MLEVILSIVHTLYTTSLSFDQELYHILVHKRNDICFCNNSYLYSSYEEAS
jgi:hypothetical protein